MSPLPAPCFSIVRTMDNVLVVFGLQEMRDGVSQAVLVAPFPCVVVLRCTHCFVRFHRDAFFAGLFLRPLATSVQGDQLI